MNSVVGIARGKRVFAAAAAAFLTFGLGAVGAPAASAADYGAANGGSLEWGFKQSFRSYITGKIANGTIAATNGATYNGSTFSLPPVSGDTSVSGTSQGTVALQGELNFTGHQKGNLAVLDTTMSDFKIRFDGQQAEIIADLVAREFQGTNYDSVGNFITTNDVAIATLNLANQPDFTASSIDLTGTAVMSQAGAKAFGGFYAAGEALDNTGGTLTLDGSADASGSAKSTSTKGANSAEECGAGALGVISDGTERDGVHGFVQEVNDTFGLWNNLLVNTDRMFCNLDALQGRFQPEQSAGTATPSGDGATDMAGAANMAGATDSGNGAIDGTDGAAANTSGVSGVNSASGFTGNTAGTVNNTAGTAGAARAARATSGGSVCTADDALGVTQASAQWGIKQSFQNYIRGSIAQGQWSLSGVGYENQQFLFAGSNGSVNPADKSGSILFPGSLNFTGHGGTLNLQMSNLEIRFTGNSGEVIAEVKSSDMGGTATSFGRTVLGTLGVSTLNITDSTVSGDASVTLTAAGSQAFADFYEAGQQLDPISFNASLGGAANCSPAQGDVASGAALDGISSGGIEAVEAGATSPTFGDSTSGTGINATGGGEGGFQIRSVGEESNNLASFGLDTGTTVMLIIAAFIVAGGSMTRFTATNPIG